jgi:hypothetical protein
MPGSRIGYGEAVKKGDEIKVSGERGTVLRVKDNVAYVQMDQPLHFMDSPNNISLENITSKMVEPSTNRLGYGTVHFLEDLKKLPAGTWSEDGINYRLKRSMKLADIEELCMESRHAGEPHCWLQAAYLNVVPLELFTRYGHPVYPE